MKTFLRKKGDFGEEKVVKFLKKRGFKILETNYQNKYGEIDIICERQKKIHFVEVKSSYSVFLAEGNMTKKKMGRIFRTAITYMMTHKLEGLEFYFDLVSINFKENKISMYPNINASFD